MSEDYIGEYDVHRLGTLEDLRNTSNDLSKARADTLQAMVNLILEHKKEITKVPSATTFAGARAWAEKRKHLGYRAEEVDIAGDEEKEAVVYDKAGRPFMINGYKLKPSDYGIRKAYWTANPTPEKRAGNPMREWAVNYVWDVQEDEDNVWNRSVKKTDKYETMKAWGYRMPTKPKKEISPYAIFSKTVAEIVKDTLTDYVTETIKDHDGKDIAAPNLYARFRMVFGSNAPSGDNNCKFLKKLISPIAIYRYLYMRCVEQKYYYALKNSETTKNMVYNYTSYKEYVKKHKETFRKWFMDTIMDSKTRYEKFKTGWLNKQTVLDMFVKGALDETGKDLNDGIVHLIGPKNFNRTINLRGGQIQFTIKDLLCNNELAGNFLRELEDKKSELHKACKQQFEICKRESQRSIDIYFKNDAVKKQFFENKSSEGAFQESLGFGIANATDPESAQRQAAAASSPVKPPVVKPVKEESGEVDKEAEAEAQRQAEKMEYLASMAPEDK